MGWLSCCRTVRRHWILGGMLGMITGLDGINMISQAIGWSKEDIPLDSILRSGRGGVLAAVIGVYFMVKIEKAIRKKMPDSLDIVFTPILTLIVTLIPYIFVVMPVCGLISSGLCWIVRGALHERQYRRAYHLRLCQCSIVPADGC